MKKLMKGVIFLFLVGIITISCEKEDSFNEKLNTEISLKNKTTNSKSNEVTYLLEENFESEFESFALDFFGNHPDGLIDIQHLPSSAQYALTTDDIGPIDPTSGARIVCRGERSSVIACATRYAEQNAFGCIPTVSRQYYGDGSGNYTYRADVPDGGGC